MSEPLEQKRELRRETCQWNKIMGLLGPIEDNELANHIKL